MADIALCSVRLTAALVGVDRAQKSRRLTNVSVFLSRLTHKRTLADHLAAAMANAHSLAGQSGSKSSVRQSRQSRDPTGSHLPCSTLLANKQAGGSKENILYRLESSYGQI